MIVTLQDMPPKVRGATVRSFDDGEEWYTVILNSSLSVERQKSAYEHELMHINRGDFDADDVEEVERR